MFSFFKKKADSTNVPEWASFFNGNEYAVFITEIDKYFKKLNIPYQISDGQILVNQNEFGFGNMGLVNVAQVCKQGKAGHYTKIITEHFDALIRAKQFDFEFAKIADNFEEVKKYVGVRLYNHEYVASIGNENFIGREFAGDIYAMIVFDFPDSITSIKPEQTSAWNKTIDELFNTGVENIKNSYPVAISKQKFDEFSIWFAQSDHFFTPNIVFDIENIDGLTGSKGSLIGIPHRHAAIIYPIEGIEVVKAINILIPTIYGMYKEGPGSLSNNLFWYQDGSYIPLPYKINDGKLQFFPPNEFVEMLNGLR